jgi:hypothetical protein
MVRAINQHHEDEQVRKAFGVLPVVDRSDAEWDSTQDSSHYRMGS